MVDATVSPVQLAWDAVAGAAGYRVHRNGALVAVTGSTTWTAFPTLAGRAHAYTVAAFTLGGETSPPSPAVAAPPAPSREIWLSEVEPDAWRQGYGPLGRDAAILGTPISIGGRRFARGLATHAASEVAYHLGGQYARFTASVGRDDSHREGSVVFRVMGDGRLLYESPVTRGGEPPRPVDVPLAGVAELVLVVDDAGDGTHFDHADWAEARLVPR